MTIDLSQTLEYLQSLELKTVDLKMSDGLQQIEITDSSIQDQKSLQDRSYVLEVREDRYFLRFRAPFDYRDYFSNEDADLIKSNRIASISKSIRTISACLQIIFSLKILLR